MGLIEWLAGPAAPIPTTTTSEPAVYERAIEDAIAAAIGERQLTFSMADATALPPVARAIDLIVSVASTFQPVEYVGGTATAEQPRFIRRPDPFSSRQDFIAMTVAELVQEGEWYWLLGEQLEGYPSFAMVLPHDEVQVDWDDRRFGRRYGWRGRELIQGQTIYHGSINRRPGELHGRSALRAALPYLAALDAAEAFAAASFGASGIPTTVLKSAAKLTKDEADKLKRQWADARRAGQLTGEPAVASGGIEPVFPDVDPQRMQLAEARSAGATSVARLLGIPGPLLLAETSGSSVTYQNVDAIVNQFTKVTVLPRYLSPIEAALSDLVPRTKAVRFSMQELVRADVTTRFGVYAQAVPLGIMDVAEVRAFEGYPPAPPPLNSFAGFDPVPRIETETTAISEAEVPA